MAAANLHMAGQYRGVNGQACTTSCSTGWAPCARYEMHKATAPTTLYARAAMQLCSGVYALHRGSLADARHVICVSLDDVEVLETSSRMNVGRTIPAREANSQERRDQTEIPSPANVLRLCALICTPSQSQRKPILPFRGDPVATW